MKKSEILSSILTFLLLCISSSSLTFLMMEQNIQHLQVKEVKSLISETKYLICCYGLSLDVPPKLHAVIEKLFTGD